MFTLQGKQFCISLGASLLLSLFLVFTVSAEDEGADTADFSTWLKEFKTFALENAIKKETLEKGLKGLEVDKGVLKLIAHQPEFTKSVWEYLDSAVSKSRILTGRKLLSLHDTVLKNVEREYGVQPEYVIAVWGLESSYGKNFGNYHVIRSLATLAFGSDRKDFYRQELLAALRIIQDEHMEPEQMIGSWAGAMGHAQFMPTSFEKHAVSFDGDERKDLWNSLDDVFASTANFLEKAGWEAGQPWGMEVKLPENFDWSLADPTTWLTIKEWADFGVIRADERPLNSLDKRDARVFLPAGHSGPAFLTFKNFLAFKQYNNADSYALAVGYLGDRIRGGKEIVAAWPRSDVPLSFIEKQDLQFLLTVLGYDTGGIDGKIGPNTRQALRNWQQDMGLPADGYVNENILNLLR